MIGKLVEYFVGSFFISIATYYVAIKITERKFELFKWNVLRWVLLETLIFIFLYVWNFSNIFRIAFNIIIMTIFHKIIFKDSILKNMIISFFSFSIIALLELLFMVIINYFPGLVVYVKDDRFFMTIYSNIFISTFLILIVNIRTFLLSFRKIINGNIPDNGYEIVFVIFGFSMCLSTLIGYIFFDINPLNSLFIVFILMLCYISFPLLILKERIEKERIKFEYNSALKNIKDYEYSLDKQRMRNHENRNMLISIRSMIEKKDVDTINFINQLLNDNRLEENQDILALTNNIPLGGLQGLIYQKMLIMNNKKIKFIINVDKQIKKSSFKKLSIKTIKNICMIIGVFLDNAIEEVENKSKKFIGIKLYQENSLIIIEISNNYFNIDNINLFDKKRFTTKNDGHGFGLSLVQEIIGKDNNLKNEKTIIGNVFVQKLIIKVN